MKSTFDRSRPVRALLASGAACALVLLGPVLPGNGDALRAQVSSMLVQVTEDGRPATDVGLFALTPEGRRELATTGTSGLAVVEFGRVPIAQGARVAAWAVTCDGSREVLFSRADAALPLLADDCRRESLGVVAWYRTERLDVTLGDAPAMRATIATEIVEARSGFRPQVGPVFTFVGGEDLDNVGVGIGGEAMLGYDWLSGLGLGAGFGFSYHSLDGSDEGLWRLSIFAEPRYSFDRPQWTVRPYLAGRVAWQNLDAEEGAGLQTESGWSFGGGAGVVVPLFLGLSADFSIRYEYLSVSASGFDRTGNLLTLGLGIRF